MAESSDSNINKEKTFNEINSKIVEKFWQPSPKNDAKENSTCEEGGVAQELIRLFHAINHGYYPGQTPPKGIILHGEPGTGKTHLMNLIAEEMFGKGNVNKRMVVIHGPAIYSQYYGKSEENLRVAFLQAEHLAKKAAQEKKGSLALIYIDELDSLAPNRATTRGDLEPRIVGELLTRMDGFKQKSGDYRDGHVIVVGSTNRLSEIDPALKRPGRFGFEFEFKSATPADDVRKLMRIILENEVGKDEFEKDYYDIADEDLDAIKERIFDEAKIVTPAEILGILHKAQMHALRGHSSTRKCKILKDSLEYAVENYPFKSKRKQTEKTNRRIKIKKNFQNCD